MKIYIVTTDKDLSRFSLEKAALAKSSECIILYYHTLMYADGILQHEGKKLELARDDKMIIRWPWDAENVSQDYNVIVKMLLQKFRENITLDYEILQSHSPYYEDKLFQHALFDTYHISTPRTWFSPTIENLKNLPFPIVAKKRISSRSKGNFLIRSLDELENRFADGTLEYIFQEFIHIRDDLRILMLQGEVIGVVKRMTHIREEERLAVKGMEVYVLNNPEIISECSRLQKELDADFVGFDVLIDESGKYWIIEANMSPQFNRFEEVTGVDVSSRVIDALIL